MRRQEAIRIHTGEQEADMQDDVTQEYTIRRIAVIHTDFGEKFGIPRQSGLADTRAEIIFEPEYASTEAVRGLDAFNYLWLI